jgi:hypothetical protein
MLKKVWSDPVWSKVISAVILAVGGFIITVIYSATTKLPLEQSIKYLWQYKIELGTTIVGIILILLVLAIIQKIAEKSPTKSEKMASKFHQKYKKFDEPTLPITYRFNAYISTLTNFPFISELRVYCTNHNGRESLMTSYNGCPDQNCTNHRQTFSESLLKSQIETDLLKEWENMNK